MIINIHLVKKKFIIMKFVEFFCSKKLKIFFLLIDNVFSNLSKLVIEEGNIEYGNIKNCNIDSDFTLKI